MLSREATEKIVKDTMAATGITDVKTQRGQLIGEIMKTHKGDVDGQILNQVITQLMNN